MASQTTLRAAAAEAGATRQLLVEDVMTPQPMTIGREESLATAHELMRRHGYGQLPVLEGGELIGVITRRDLDILETLGGVDLALDQVGEAMRSDMYGVPPDASLDEVSAQMAATKTACAVVIEQGRVIGVFTTTDALRVLAGILPEARKTG